MSNAIFAKSLSAAAADVTLGAPLPSDIAFATASLEIVNTAAAGSAAVTFSIAITSAATPGAADFVETQASLDPGAVYNRSCFLMAPGEKVVLNASAATLAARFSALTEPATP